MNLDYHIDHAEGSVERLAPPIDKYEIANFAHDDFKRFMALVELLSPRDQEIILCFALLQKRPTDLSILFGKAGHRAQEDLHKAAHKLAGLIEFGPLPETRRLGEILKRNGIAKFANREFDASLREYAENRDFPEMSRRIRSRGLRQQMFRAFKALHATKGRDEGLLAGWILWLVDGSDPKGKGWKKRKRSLYEYKTLGPTVFHTPDDFTAQYDIGYKKIDINRSVAQKGGQRQRPDTVKIKRHMKFVLKGM